MTNGSNFKRVFVAKNCTRTVGLLDSNLNELLAPGEILVLDQGGKIINTEAKAKAAKAFQIVQGSNGQSPIYSPMYKKKDVKSFKSSKFLQAKPFSYVIGSDGTNGFIDVVGVNNYMVGLEFESNISVGNANPYITKVNYTSAASGDSQFNIANSLVKLLSLNFTQFNEATPKATVVTDATGAAGLTTAAVTRGSKAVSYGGGTPVLGGAYKIPGYVGIYGTEAAGVYTVTAIDSVNSVVTLDKEYNGTTQASVSIAYIADTSSTSGDNYGIKIEPGIYGQKNGYEAYMKATIDVMAGNFYNTTLVEDYGDFGSGRHELVANGEIAHQSYFGRNALQTVEFQNPSVVTDAGTGYSSVMFQTETSERINTVETNGQPSSTVIYLQRGTYEALLTPATATLGTNILNGTGIGGAAGDGVLTVLNALMVDIGVINATANTIPNGGNEITAGANFGAAIDV